MYVKKLREGYHYLQDGNDDYEPLRGDVTCGLVVGYVEAKGPTRPHSHPAVEQVYYIRSGRGIVTIDDDEREVEKDDVIYIPAGASHGIRPVEGESELTYLYLSHLHEISSRDRQP